MIALPSALAAWADELAQLPTDLALALAPWLGRLALAVGPMAERRSVRTGEPDGFTGLARRGSYERLVISEWALADALPEEFLRRAAGGEHLFHELARRGSQGARRAVAIVSAGPAQLGTPRLAHLALLVVLARRAAQAGASFAWGVLEDPARALIEGVELDGVRRLLAARTVRHRDDDVAQWRATLTDAAIEPWWIGDGSDLAAARGDRCLVVRDVLVPGQHALTVEVQHRGPSRTVRLELPPAATCAQLLRAPVRGVAEGRRTARTDGVARGLQFALGGRRLLVELDGRVECWPVPNSPRDQIGRPRPWVVPEGYELVALGAEQRTVLAVIAPADAHDIVEVATPTGGGRAQVRLPPEVRRRTRTARVGACGLVDLDGAGRALVFELDGHLLIIDTFPGTQRSYQVSARRLYCDDGAVVAAAITGRQVLWLARPAGATTVWRFDRDGARTVASCEGELDDTMAFGHDVAAVGVWGPVAIASRGACTLHSDGRAPAGFTVDGPVVGARGRAALVQVDACRLEWHGGPRPLAALTTTAPIAMVAVATPLPYVAALTVRGEIVVINSRDDVLMRLVPGERSPA